MAEKVIMFVVILICATPLIALGIAQYRSVNPVGFWTGKKPPAREQIKDVRAYNHKHGLMWILYGLGLMLCLCSMIFVRLEIAMTLVLIECIGGIFVMIAYHNMLDRKYLTNRRAISQK